jgi:hypothetical protein
MILQIVSEPYELSRPAQKLFADLAAEIEKLNAEAAKLDAETATIQGMGVVSITPATIDRARKVAYGRFDLDQRILKLVGRLLAEWLPTREDERRRVVDAAYADIESATQDVRSRLQSIGYDESTADQVAIHHPLVVAARVRHEELRSIGGFDPWLKNYKGIEQEVLARLELERRRILAL